MRTIRDYFFIFLKGMAMGSADVVPGVSGGTIAFISGIYEELLDTISSVNIKSVAILFKEGIKPFWKAINGNFLAALLLGIGVSIASLAKAISYTLENHPIVTWSFFFGLVLASIPLVWKKIKKVNLSRYGLAIVGALIAYAVISIPPTQDPGSLWYLFLSGMIAICAMILPGISGSFLLIILGSYLTMLSALSNFEIVPILVFIGGAVIGLLSFSRVLKFLFANYHDLTVATLAGFLIGSLAKIWPWKNVLTWFVKHPGESNEKTIALVEENVSPFAYAELTQEPTQLLGAVIAASIGILLIVGLERLATKSTAK